MFLYNYNMKFNVGDIVIPILGKFAAGYCKEATYIILFIDQNLYWILSSHPEASVRSNQPNVWNFGEWEIEKV